MSTNKRIRGFLIIYVPIEVWRCHTIDEEFLTYLLGCIFPYFLWMRMSISTQIQYKDGSAIYFWWLYCHIVVPCAQIPNWVESILVRKHNGRPKLESAIALKSSTLPPSLPGPAIVSVSRLPICWRRPLFGSKALKGAVGKDADLVAYGGVSVLCCCFWRQRAWPLTKSPGSLLEVTDAGANIKPIIVVKRRLPAVERLGLLVLEPLGLQGQWHEITLSRYPRAPTSATCIWPVCVGHLQHQPLSCYRWQ